MMHKPILIQNLCFSLPHRTCFSDFSTVIQPGSRIALMGNNGSGKSVLLQMLQGQYEPTMGTIQIPRDLVLGVVPQVIVTDTALSGGERFNEALTAALVCAPDVLLLDEPTNHLDQKNRKHFMRMLKQYQGTVIVATHDRDILRHSVESLWHIHHQTVTVYSGQYDDYMNELAKKKLSIDKQLKCLKLEKTETHLSLMKEQKRAAKSKSKGEKSARNRKWPTGGKGKAIQGEQTTGRLRSEIEQKKQALLETLAGLHIPQVIVPRFSVPSGKSGKGYLISIREGSVGYCTDKPLIHDINFNLSACERVALIGDNGSGKTTLLKAIMGQTAVITTGEWHLVNTDEVGYLDQHYGNLEPKQTVIEALASVVPTWTTVELRNHLSDFLFRENEVISSLISQLSGGEKCRLVLAQIAANTPKLLILDEITNNLDQETKDHVGQVLRDFPGAIIAISHETNFLDEIGINRKMAVNSYGRLVEQKEGTCLK